jgi:integrase
VSSKKRNPARQGIEVREDSQGVEQFRGYVTERGSQKKVRGPWTYKLSEARAWRNDALGKQEAGTLSADRGLRLREAVEQFVEGIENGSIRNRSGERFKPSVVRSYRRDLKKRVAPELGAIRLNDLKLPEVQRFVDKLQADGLAAGTVRNAIMALRSLIAWARPRGLMQRNPCDGLRLPTGGNVRDRIATPAECALLVGALPVRDREAFALACYAGLRAGEVLALDWTHIDLDRATIRVQRAWDHGDGVFIKPKSKAAERKVPITSRLLDLLRAYRETTGGVGLLFPARGRWDRPISHSGLVKRNAAAWDTAALTRLGLHEARHTFASMLIASGANAKAISVAMGHGSIQITFDRYGHLMPGSEDEVRGLLDAYLLEAV